MDSVSELRDIEVEALRSACSDSDFQVSFRYSDSTLRGTFRIFADLPCHDCMYVHAPASNVPLNNDCVIERHADSWVYELKHLPPIRLHFRLPSGYPGTDSQPVIPELSLRSVWIPKSILLLLTERLNEICKAAPGELVLWSLVELLRGESHQFMLKSQLPGSPEIMHFDLVHFYDSHRDEMRLSLSNCTELLLLNNDDRLDAEFQRSLRECPVCLETKLGCNYFRFRVCRHAVCLDCVQQAFTYAVDGGITALHLGCLICDTTVGYNEARSVLPPGVFSRYEALLLNRSLNTMSDIAYCPRATCQNMPVILDDTDLGRCTNCGFAFCPKCLRPYHGADECETKANKEVVEDTETLSDDEPLTAEEYAAREKENNASYDYVEKCCKYCPGCWSPIEKDYGCNKIHCAYCRCYFCWLCLEVLTYGNPYDHFKNGGNCSGKLFLGLEPDEENEDNGD